MVSEILRLALHGADKQFSIAFMFSPIYLRLEEEPPPPPHRIGMLEPVQMETQIAGTCMVEDDFFLLHSCLVQST